jgi:signal transduction histidine kinase
MDETEQSRRIWVLTIRRFAEMAWARHGTTRYLSVTFVPVMVALAVPGWWWALCAIFTILAAIVDRRAHRFFERIVPELATYEEPALRALVKREIAALATITALYTIPYAALAFAPGPGPLLGLVFCAGAALVCATLHVMTRTMIFHTIPVVAIGLMANAAALTSGPMSILAAALAGITAVNAIVSARGGASSFGDLIVARMKAEQAAEDLERRVEERTAQLAVATRRAQAANRAKSLFLANMSHELRTPLNAVIGYAEIISEDLESGDTRASAEDLLKIRGAAGHLLTLINEVLDLSRIEAGKLDLKEADYDLAALLRSALDAVKPTAAKQHTTCTLTIAAGAATLLSGDETRVRQCVLNLLSNAAKFTANGAIALEVRPCRIGGAAGVAIAVRDTGAGISAENLARLFQPFTQVDSSATRTHDGAGLGLVITRRLARAMGGDVAASSKLGEGSTFTFYLPAKAAASSRAAA